MAFAAYLYCFRREPERALDAAEGAVRYSNEQALAQFQPNEALAALNNAVSIAESTEERFYQREIHRVRAQLTAGA